MRRRKNVYFKALTRFVKRGRNEVDRCTRAGAYLAGCTLIGAMTENVLMAMLRMFPDVVYRYGRKLRVRWDLGKLIEFAHDCGWFDQAVYEAAERIRMNRNLLHPNWYASRKPPRITRGMLAAREVDFGMVLARMESLVI
jgi:hypothetical protein